jgi:hypothetical protein
MRLAGLAASPIPSAIVSRLLFSLPMREHEKQRDEPHSLGTRAGRPAAPPSSARFRRPPESSARLRSPESRFWRHGQAKAGASPGAYFPSAYTGSAALSGDAIDPDDPAAVLRMAEAVGGQGLFGRIPAFPSAHSCGFSPGKTGDDVLEFHHRSPVRRPPRGIRRSVHFSPAFQSSRGRFTLPGRLFVLPAALMGFNPSQLYSGRTVPRRLPPRRPT